MKTRVIYLNNQLGPPLWRIESFKEGESLDWMVEGYCFSHTEALIYAEKISKGYPKDAEDDVINPRFGPSKRLIAEFDNGNVVKIYYPNPDGIMYGHIY